MKLSTAILLSLIALGYPSSLHAADPAVCRPFARTLTDAVIRYVWLRAYTGCLNAEGEPEMPADGLAALRSVLPEATPVWPLDRSDVAAIKDIGNVPATDPADEAVPTPPARPEKPVDAHPPPVASRQVCDRESASGFTTGSPEQAAWCRKNYRSFDATTGTVICARGALKGKRDKCA